MRWLREITALLIELWRADRAYKRALANLTPEQRALIRQIEKDFA